MKQFISQDGDAITVSNMPVKVNSKATKQLEISEEDMQKIEDPAYTFNYKDKKFNFTAKPISPNATLRTELKAKALAETLTDADVKKAFKLLL